MEVRKIMDLLSDSKLEALGLLLNADKKNSKITASFIVKSFVWSALMKCSISLRGVASLCNKKQVGIEKLLKVSNKEQAKIDHSSLGKRINKLSIRYFRELYEDLSEKSEKILSKSLNSKLYRFDSTITSLAGRVIKGGLDVGGVSGKNQIKLTVGLKGSIPRSVRFCSEQTESSEDVALVRAINEVKMEKDEVLLFDRGISKCTTYKEFSNAGTKFVTRVKLGRKYYTVEKREILYKGDLEILSDEVVHLYSKKKVINHNLRLIKAVNKNGIEIWFLSNMLNHSIEDITNLYSRRWDIEVFFKFIKQHLQFKHFISHSSNGMTIYMYSILIAALLFLIYKHTNNKKGFKLVMMDFTLSMVREIARDAVTLSGGDHNLVPYLRDT